MVPPLEKRVGLSLSFFKAEGVTRLITDVCDMWAVDVYVMTLRVTDGGPGRWSGTPSSSLINRDHRRHGGWKGSQRTFGPMFS